MIDLNRSLFPALTISATPQFQTFRFFARKALHYALIGETRLNTAFNRRVFGKMHAQRLRKYQPEEVVILRKVLRC
jgi:hypothetical protein